MKGDEFPLERWSEINGEIHGVLSNLWWLQQKKIVVSSAELSRQFMTRVGRLFPTTSHEFSLCFSATWWFIPRIVSGLVHPSYKWTLPPLIPLKSPGLVHPLTIRGKNHQVYPSVSHSPYPISQLHNFRNSGEISKGVTSSARCFNFPLDALSFWAWDPLIKAGRPA